MERTKKNWISWISLEILDPIIDPMIIPNGPSNDHPIAPPMILPQIDILVK